MRSVIIMALLSSCIVSLDNVPGSETGQELSSSYFDVPSVKTLQQSSILLLVGEGDLVLGVDLLVFGTVAVEQHPHQPTVVVACCCSGSSPTVVQDGANLLPDRTGIDQKVVKQFP